MRSIWLNRLAVLFRLHKGLCARVQDAIKPSHYVHGDGVRPLPAQARAPACAEAAVFLSETCRQYPDKVILCPVGPLTSYRSLADYDPEITKYVKKLVIMGGAWCGISLPRQAIWNDLADMVFAADWEIDLIGLMLPRLLPVYRMILTACRVAARYWWLFSRYHQIYIDFYHSVGEYIIA